MLFWLLFFLIITVLLFGIVVFVGPPYLPTLRKQLDTALDMLDLKPGETLLELGSGDGRVLLAAAKRDIKVVGIELNPILVVVSIIMTWKYRQNVRVIWASYWGPQWPRADGIFTFMLPRYMAKLDQRIELWHPKAMKVASFAFKIPGKEPIDKQNGIYLYEYK